VPLVRPLEKIISSGSTISINSAANLTTRWKAALSDGHVNTYALFTALALERVRPGGLIALVIPTSFVGGPYFAKLRQLILAQAEVLSLDLIDRRSDIFLDVTQDTCVLLARRHRPGTASGSNPSCALIASDGSARYLGQVEVPAGGESRYWVLPSAVGTPSTGTPFFDPGFRTLEDYGYRVRSGHFVWNRNREKIISGPDRSSTDIPLLWANDVKRGLEIYLHHKPGERDHVRLPRSAVATVIQSDAVLLQRTTNRSQPYRLNACVVRTVKQPVPGFVSENHTIVVEPVSPGSAKLPVEVLALLLNSRAVDERFRRVSGTVSVSVKALRTLPLPKPELFLFGLSCTSSADEAAQFAFVNSASQSATPASPTSAAKSLVLSP